MTYEPCGCLQHPDFPNVLFPCALHADTMPVSVYTIENEAVKAAREQAEIEEEGARMNGWTG